MSGISLDRSFHRRCSGQREFRRHVGGQGSEHVILIDVDSDPFDQVVIIDVPEPKKRRYPRDSRAKKWSYVNIIHIDDDEIGDNGHSIGVENVGTSSRAGASQFGKNFAGPGKTQFVSDNVTPVRLSKCKRTYSGNTSGANLHGFDAASGSIPSHFDFCDLVEDSSGKVQELWRKGSSQTTNVDVGHSESARNIRSPVIDRDDDRRNFEAENQSLNSQEAFSNAEPENELSMKFCSDLNEGAEALGVLNQGTDPCEIDQDQVLSEARPFWSIGVVHGTHLEVSNLHENEHKEEVSSFLNSGEIQKGPEDALASEHDCIFQEREKIKETDEYQKAMEEEWASRQEALRVQAEEAKQLKLLAKRKRAEAMRLLDMERRQKERLEEIRNTQKKEEEILNLREAIRVEVQKELSVLESKCKKSMASLLHELGISVAGWPDPSPQQVLISYKKALLTFHPDRASRSEIRQQVEAEEKFKLINRLKGNIL